MHTVRGMSEDIKQALLMPAIQIGAGLKSNTEIITLRRIDQYE